MTHENRDNGVDWQGRSAPISSSFTKWGQTPMQVYASGRPSLSPALKTPLPVPETRLHDYQARSTLPDLRPPGSWTSPEDWGAVLIILMDSGISRVL